MFIAVPCSGIDIHYDTSPLTEDKYQALASKLIIGQRVIPQLLIRAADGRPYEIQDLLPADVRFKVLIFTGDTGNKAQLEILSSLAERLETVLTKYARDKDVGAVFEVLSIR